MACDLPRGDTSANYECGSLRPGPWNSLAVATPGLFMTAVSWMPVASGSSPPQRKNYSPARLAPRLPPHLAPVWEDRTARLWDARDGLCLMAFCGHEDRVMACGVAASTSGRSGLVLTAGYDRTVRLWRLTNGEGIGTLIPRGGCGRALPPIPARPPLLGAAAAPVLE